MHLKGQYGYVAHIKKSIYEKATKIERKKGDQPGKR